MEMFIHFVSGEEYWEFGRVNGNVVSVMLMTDGVWEQACPQFLGWNSSR